MARSTLLPTILAAAVMALAAAAPPGARASGHEILEIAVEFPVRNSNDASGVSCAADDLPYTVRGHLAGPRAALEGPGPRVVTFYQYGFDTGEFNWRFREAPGHDWPRELARRGHVSLTIDMLGYDASGHPHGNASCMGSQAEVSHQIVSMLRQGTYLVPGGGLPIAFSGVVLAGHDVGGAVVEIDTQAYADTPFGRIDGLIVMGYADQGLTPYALELAAAAREVCSQGGQESEPGGPGGYHFFGPPDQDFREQLFYDADPAVIDGVLRLRNRNPCGYLGSILQWMTLAQLRLAEIEVPVLLLYSDQDPVFTMEGRQLQELHFLSSPDVTTIFQLDSGHFPMFERNAAEYRETVSNWLCTRGLVSADVVACAALAGKVTGGGQVASALPNEDERAKFNLTARVEEPGKGKLRYDDGAAGIRIRASGFDQVVVEGERAVISGSAEVNGALRPVRVTVEDRGEPGRENDLFAIEVLEPDGYANAPQALLGGNIQIHR